MHAKPSIALFGDAVGSANPHHPIRADWLALTQEAAIDPDLPIIDPHHHLWDNTRGRYLVDDLARDIANNGQGHNVVGTIYVECRAMWRAAGPDAMRAVGEVEFAAGQAAMSESGIYGPTQVCAGIISHVDLRLGAAVPDVVAAEEAVSGGRLRGVRHITVWDGSPDVRCTSVLPPSGLLADPRFLEGFRHLADLALSFDAWLYHTQLLELVALARAHEDTLIVVDHCGGLIGVGSYTHRSDEAWRAWQAGIRELSACPNVRIKLGGFGIATMGFDFHRQLEPPNSDDLAEAWRAIINTCVDAFSPQRCMFESNFPVDKGSYSYTTLWNAFKRIASTYSDDERADMFWRTAQDTYKIQVV